MEAIRKEAREAAGKITDKAAIIQIIRDVNRHAYQENRQSIRRVLYAYISEFLYRLEELE